MNLIESAFIINRNEFDDPVWASDKPIKAIIKGKCH